MTLKLSMAVLLVFTLTLLLMYVTSVAYKTYARRNVEAGS